MTEEQNHLDIDLGTRTLTFLGGLKDDQIPEHLRGKMREVVVNICEFQYRFAMPMELPFDLGSDFEEVLEMERPIDVLLRYKAIYEVFGVSGDLFIDI